MSVEKRSEKVVGWKFNMNVHVLTSIASESPEKKLRFSMPDTFPFRTSQPPNFQKPRSVSIALRTFDLSSFHKTPHLNVSKGSSQGAKMLRSDPDPHTTPVSKTTVTQRGQRLRRRDFLRLLGSVGLGHFQKLLG